MELFAVCAPGLEPVLLSEVQALGLSGRAVGGGVELSGGPLELMRLNLWLRTASRVLVRLGEIKATAFPELVRKASALPWEKYISKSAQLRVTCRKSRLYHSAAVAERLHAAIEARVGGKVALEKPDEEERAGPQLIVARFDHDVCTLSADSSGALLHMRGYRGPQAKAPLRETLAAALLLAAGFKGETALCDPLCGSGTIAIEGALIAMRRAPGWKRDFAFQKWPGFDVGPFQDLLTAARAGERKSPVIIEASDQDAGAIAATRENAAAAGVSLTIAQRQLAQLPADAAAGLIACNPPYGVRLGADPRAMLRELETVLRRRPRWTAAAVVVTATMPRWKPLLTTQNGGLRVQFVKSGDSLQI